MDLNDLCQTFVSSRPKDDISTNDERSSLGTREHSTSHSPHSRIPHLVNVRAISSLTASYDSYLQIGCLGLSMKKDDQFVQGKLGGHFAA